MSIKCLLILGRDIKAFYGLRPNAGNHKGRGDELRITGIAGWFVKKIHEFSLQLQNDYAGQLH